MHELSCSFSSVQELEVKTEMENFLLFGMFFWYCTALFLIKIFVLFTYQISVSQIRLSVQKKHTKQHLYFRN